jgi:hypothetical protein
MPWQTLIERGERLPAWADLAEGYAALLHRLGPVTPFELAVVGARCVPPSSAVCGRRICRLA